jgi:hypothetical protein
VGKSQILGEEVLSEIIKLAVVRAQPVSSSDATHTSQLVHVLLEAVQSAAGHIQSDREEAVLTTSVHDPAKYVLFFPFTNIISGTTLR